MNTRKPVLGSTAPLLFSCAMIAAAPVLAGCAGPNADYTAMSSAMNVPCEPNGEFAQRLAMPNVPNTLMCLESVADVNNELFNTPVVDSAGYRVAHFRRIETKAPGDVVAVLTLNSSGRAISMYTDHVRYEPATRVIIADLTGLEMNLVPSEFPYGWLPSWSPYL